MTELEQTFFDYIQNAYPQNLRTMSFSENSLVYKYDVVRSFTIATLSSIISDAAKQLTITTATESWLSEWESFLWMVVAPVWATVAKRRTLLLTKIFWSNPTVSTIKNLVRSLIWWDWTNIAIDEYYTHPGVLPEEVFTYKVTIFEPTDFIYTTENIREVLEEIQPAHCTLLLDIRRTLVDAVWFTAGYAYTVHTAFVWAADWAGTTPWWDESDWPMVWHHFL